MHDYTENSSKQKPTKVTHRKQEPNSSSFTNWKHKFASELKHDRNQGNEEKGVESRDQTCTDKGISLQERVKKGNSDAGASHANENPLSVEFTFALHGSNNADTDDSWDDGAAPDNGDSTWQVLREPRFEHERKCDRYSVENAKETAKSDK